MVQLLQCGDHILFAGKRRADGIGPIFAVARQAQHQQFRKPGQSPAAQRCTVSENPRYQTSEFWNERARPIRRMSLLAMCQLVADDGVHFRLGEVFKEGFADDDQGFSGFDR